MNIDRALSSVLTIAVVAIAAVLVRDELTQRRATRANRVIHADGPLQFDKRWPQFSKAGITIGDAKAPVQLTEFADLECPACRLLQPRLDSIRSVYGSRVAVTFVNFPLSFHRFAKVAALAAECADAQGRFAEFVGETYQKQDSLGLKSWADFARDARVSDTTKFNACVRSGAMSAKIDKGVQLGQEIDVAGTPTLYVNGWQFPVPPNVKQMSKAIDAILSGKPPAID